MSEPTSLQIADAVIQAHTVQIMTLRRGRLFELLGETYKLLYANECRAHVQAVRDETVSVKDRKFHVKRYFDIAPSTIVQIRRKGPRP